MGKKKKRTPWGARQKAWILAAVFVLAVFIGMRQAPEGAGQVSRGSTGAAASLPVLYAEFGTHKLNPLYGYSSKMRSGAEQQSVYPFCEEELDMTLHLLDAGERPREVSFELRSEDGSRLIERGSVTDFSGSRNDSSFKLHFQDLLDPEVYYRLELTVAMSTRSAHYYTRVMKTDAETTAALVDYAAALHESLFRAESAAAYTNKLEPDGKADNKTLAYVNIHCSMKQLCWENFGIQKASDSWLTLEAMQGNYGYFHYSYLVKADAGGAAPAKFRVREAMTLQKNQKQMYLLCYERHMEQLFEVSEGSVISDGILLGVQEAENVRVLTSPGGNVTVFSVAGELYSYNSADQTLASIFSFRGSGEHALRSLNQDYAVKPLEADDKGNVEFAVYGYMNGGDREGSCGAAYYRYDAEDQSLTELLYLESDRCYELLKQDVETLFRKAGDQFLYFCFDRQVYVMDISSGETAVLVTEAELESLVLSGDGSAFAWQSGTDQTFPGSVRVIHLGNDTNLSVEAPEGEFIRTLGYIQEDLILGYGRLTDSPISDGEGERWPMYRLKILDEAAEPIFDYSYKDILLSRIGQDSGKIHVERYGNVEGKYKYLQDDVLLRDDGSVKAAESPLSVHTHSTLERMLLLPFNRLPSLLRMNVTESSEAEPGIPLTLPEYGGRIRTERFCAYGGGRCLGCFATAGEAIAEAEKYYGYVISTEGTLLWFWSTKQEEKILSKDLAAAGENGREVSGISLRAVMHFIDTGQALKWYSPDKGERWVLGYEWQNVVLLNPKRNKVYRMTQEEFAENIARHNNYLWVYPEK